MGVQLSLKQRATSAVEAAPAPGPVATNVARSPDNGLGRLAGWCYDHRHRVLLGWVLVVVAMIRLAQWAGSRLDNNLSLGSSPSQQAQNLLASHFPSEKGDSTGPIDPWIPLMMFTVVFGLSMDYEVFLLSRMREEWHRSGDNSAAVADGLVTTARVITAAAAIMICVFGSFVINDPVRILDVFGLGLAVAVLVDATVVRMVLVPAVMQLLGPANWWLHRWLERAIPNVAVESSAAHVPSEGKAPAQPVYAGSVE